MILRFTLLTISFFFYSFLQAQDKVILNNQDGMYVSYELTKIDAGTKKDTYLVVVKAENKNDYDVFYSVPLTKQANGSNAVSILENKLFAQSVVRNSTALFGDNINLAGQETKLITNDNRILYSISKGNFITAEKEFKVKPGVKPIITNTFLLPLKSIDNFDIAINEAAINGDWNSNCGNMQMTLTLTKNEKNETVIHQLVNGKQIVWRKTTANTFEKLNDSTTTLSYNKQNNSFSYSTTDGVSCLWTKK
jgi:hypothetical protein